MDDERLTPAPLPDTHRPTHSLRQKSVESLNSHPLLATPPKDPQARRSPSAEHHPSYVVSYKPRQKTLSTASPPPQPLVATSTPISPESSSISTSSPSATSKLLAQSVQAKLQEAGLSTESAGYLLIQKLAQIDPAKDKYWETAFHCLTNRKVILLLPKQPLDSLDLSPSFFNDHAILTTNHSSTFATLSGLRGSISDNTAQISSSVQGVNEIANSSRGLFVIDDETEKSILGTTSKIPLPDHPRFTISSRLDISLQRQLASSQGEKAKPRTLATLFGGVRQGTTAADSTNEEELVSSGPPIDISVMVIDTIVRRTTVVRTLSQNLITRVNEALKSEDPHVVQVVRTFLHCFIPASPLTHKLNPRPILNSTRSEKDISVIEQSSLYTADLDDLTAAVQELYYDVRSALETSWRLKTESITANGDEKTELALDVDAEVDASMEAVEALVTSELYDRIFCSPSSTDSHDDDNLASRIAGLHMLDLSLEHLGLRLDGSNPEDWNADSRKLREGLDEIVKTCCEDLAKLQEPSYRTPQQKLGVLVAAHQTIANGLSKLPPIPMKEDPASTPGSKSSRRRTISGHHPIEMTPNANPLNRSTSAAALHSPNTLLVESDVTPRVEKHSPSDAPSFAEKPEYFGEDNKPTSTSSSADLILPILIYSVVQANPVRLVSNVMFIQRFRADSLMRGEGEYCLTNMQAVKEFLESVDISELGLGTDKIFSAEDKAEGSFNPRLRGKQQLDSMVDSASKVIESAFEVGLGGVRMLDSLASKASASFGIARQPKTIEEVQSVLAGKARGAIRPANLLRRATSTSKRQRSATQISALNIRKKDETIKEMAEVTSPPISPLPPPETEPHSEASERLSISSRLAAIPGLSRFAGLERSSSKDEHRRHSNTPSLSSINERSAPISPITPMPLPLSRTANISSTRFERAGIQPPLSRFLSTKPEDLRMSDIPVLLAEYSRMASLLNDRLAMED